MPVHIRQGVILKIQNIVPNIKYKVQMQSIGWEKNYVSDGVLSGTVGKAKRLEAIRIKLVDNNFLFASEIKALLKNKLVKPIIDINSLRELLALGPSKTPGSGIFKSIYEIYYFIYKII